MRFLLTTIQTEETASYLRVSKELQKLGHECVHLTISPLAAKMARKAGFRAESVLETFRSTESPSRGEIADLEGRLNLGSLRELWVTDNACRNKDEEWCIRWAIAHVAALERLITEERIDIVVPDIGSETLRIAAHSVALSHQVPTMFLFFTLFPDPLRLYIDSIDSQIAPPDEIKPLSSEEQEKMERFVAEATKRNAPIVKPRDISLSSRKLVSFSRHLLVKGTVERDNPYLLPAEYVKNAVRQRLRRAAARPLYQELDSARPFVYFPLHVTDDFKVKRVTPHCVDQSSLIELVADWLPQGIDLVVKEHPRDVGRNPHLFLRRLKKRSNIVLVDPATSSRELIERSEAIAVIGSTVGAEALLHCRPVLTLGRPWYSGYGITVDVDSFRHVPEAIHHVLNFTPDRQRILEVMNAGWQRCYPGAPAGYDQSPQNAATLAKSLVQAADERTKKQPIAS